MGSYQSPGVSNPLNIGGATNGLTITSGAGNTFINNENAAGQIRLQIGGSSKVIIDDNTSVSINPPLLVIGDLQTFSNLGFYGATAIAKPTVSGSKGANAALTSLMTALANLGLVTDSTT